MWLSLHSTGLTYLLTLAPNSVCRLGGNQVCLLHMLTGEDPPHIPVSEEITGQENSSINTADWFRDKANPWVEYLDLLLVLT
jgi:hypothetical protein